MVTCQLLRGPKARLAILRGSASRTVLKSMVRISPRSAKFSTEPANVRIEEVSYLILCSTMMRLRGMEVLGVTPFDDGVCGRDDPSVPCRSIFQIPADARIGSSYAVYWLWDYSGKLGSSADRVEVRISSLASESPNSRSFILLAWTSISLHELSHLVLLPLTWISYDKSEMVPSSA